jgi:pyruvate-ferredoxin/flavodoxin oxidoreductase
MAVDSGYWPLYRFDPRRLERGEHPLVLDSAPPKTDVSSLMAAESRFQATAQQDPERYQALLARASEDIQRRRALYEELALGGNTSPGAAARTGNPAASPGPGGTR